MKTVKTYWEYMGYLITRAPINSSGIKYLANSANVGYLRADTLAGVKAIIKNESKK